MTAYLVFLIESGLSSTEEDNYAQLVLRLLNTDKKRDIISIMSRFTPNINNTHSI